MLVTQTGNLHIRKTSSNNDLKLGYWCQVRNSITGDTFLSQSAGKIILTDPQGGIAPVITDILETISIERGQTVSLPCAAQGSPPPAYRWASGIQEKMVTETSTILVTETNQPGSYIYTCIVENKFGIDEKKTKVIVKGISHNILQCFSTYSIPL